MNFSLALLTRKALFFLNPPVFSSLHHRKDREHPLLPERTQSGFGAAGH